MKQRIQDNIKLAKKYMVDSIYRAANIEGIAISYPEVQVICEGMGVSGISIHDINVVNDLKRSWLWMLENSDDEINLEMLIALNRLCGYYTVADAGKIRGCDDKRIRVPLGNGEYYYPELPPEKAAISKKLTDLQRDFTGIDLAIELFCYVCKSQFFIDGNKRTATLISNVALTQSGCGILSIPVEHKLSFYRFLSNYYENDETGRELKQFLREYCITRLGIN